MLKDIINKNRLSFSDIIFSSREIYRKNSFTFLMIVLISWLPINIVLSILEFKVLDMQISAEILTNPTMLQQFITSSAGKTYIVYTAIANILILFFTPIGKMAIAYTARNYIYDYKTNFKDAILEAFSKGIYLVPATIISLFLTSLGAMFFVIPGLIISVYLFFYTHAIILDNKSTIKALLHSYLIVKGQWLRCAFIIAILMVLRYIISYGIGTLFGWAYTGITGSVIINTIASYFDGIIEIITTVIYINLALNSSNISKTEPEFLDKDDTDITSK